METAIWSAGEYSLGVVTRFRLVVAALFALLTVPVAADSYGPNIYPWGAFDKFTPTYVPWAGVDADGNIHGIEGAQLGVNDAGNIGNYKYGPSIGAADLRGKGVQDLIMGDSYGYFWYYPNSGTPDKAIFTQAEVMPLWLGEDRIDGSTEGVTSVVPRLQIIDLSDSKKFDLLTGTYAGNLYHIPNTGSSSSPDFKPTYNHPSLRVNTHRKGVLWNNYMAPFMTMLFSRSNLFDLVTGEGTYSANSIYLLRNRNSNTDPAFDEDHMSKVIPGMGKEHLVPVVLDWNNDGKPDVLVADRLGHLTLYLGTSTDLDNPTFDDGTPITIGGADKLGDSVTVALADLTSNKLPNLLIGRNDGTVSYALNTGKIGAPEFKTPLTLVKGVLPPSYHYLKSTDWAQWQAYGAEYELVGLVNPQTQPGFEFPKDEKTKYALKFWAWPYKNIYFSKRYYPPIEDEWREHLVGCGSRAIIKLNKRYRIHFWIKSEGGNINNLRYRIRADDTNREGFHPNNVEKPISSNTAWNEISDEFQITNRDDKTLDAWGYHMEFRFNGQTTFYLDDFQIQEILEN